jgi:hypothetical protein
MRVREGSVIVFVEDPATGRLIWRGLISDETRVSTPEGAVRQMTELARQVAHEFPARSSLRPVHPPSVTEYSGSLPRFHDVTTRLGHGPAPADSASTASTAAPKSAPVTGRSFQAGCHRLARYTSLRSASKRKKSGVQAAMRRTAWLSSRNETSSRGAGLAARVWSVLQGR